MSASIAAPHFRLLRRFRRSRGGMIGAVIVLAVILVAVLAPLLAPHPFDATDLLNTWAPPDHLNPLGTDRLGRDIASRLIMGARVSLLVASSVLAITLCVGVVLGGIAGFLGGIADSIIMRTVDIVLAFPEVVLAILVAAVIGTGMTTVIVALSLVWWPGIARLTRALVLVQKQELISMPQSSAAPGGWKFFGAISCRILPRLCWSARPSASASSSWRRRR